MTLVQKCEVSQDVELVKPGDGLEMTDCSMVTLRQRLELFWKANLFDLGDSFEMEAASL